MAKIPPLQSLEDVLTLALAEGIRSRSRRCCERGGNTDRTQILESMCACRGRRESGRRRISTAGRPRHDRRASGTGRPHERREMELAWAAKKVAGASEERPWERVGGVGFGGALAGASEKKSLGWVCGRSRRVTSGRRASGGVDRARGARE